MNWAGDSDIVGGRVGRGREPPPLPSRQFGTPRVLLLLLAICAADAVYMLSLYQVPPPVAPAPRTAGLHGFKPRGRDSCPYLYLVQSGRVPTSAGAKAAGPRGRRRRWPGRPSGGNNPPSLAHSPPAPHLASSAAAWPPLPSRLP